MKKFLFFLFFLLDINSNAQQNLVLNPSFEETSTPFRCDSFGISNFGPLLNWSVPSLGTPDAYTMLLPLNCMSHALFPNYANQTPRTGNNLLAIVLVTIVMLV